MPDFTEIELSILEGLVDNFRDRLLMERDEPEIRGLLFQLLEGAIGLGLRAYTVNMEIVYSFGFLVSLSYQRGVFDLMVLVRGQEELSLPSGRALEYEFFCR